MVFFDNIPWNNLEYWFALIYKIFVDLPSYLIYAFYFWVSAFESFWLQAFLWVITTIFSGITFYSLYKIWEINNFDWEKYKAIFFIENKDEAEKVMVDKKWVDILGHLESDRPASWTLAIIESDKILDELLKEKGFDGANVGERLKSEKAGKLKNLQDAWEAHKIRNKIAHESGYILEKRDARKAIAHYESVFRELGFLNS